MNRCRAALRVRCHGSRARSAVSAMTASLVKTRRLAAHSGKRDRWSVKYLQEAGSYE